MPSGPPLRVETTGTHTVGMTIVDRRLKSAFGERYGVTIACEPEQWTRVSFTIPKEQP